VNHAAKFAILWLALGTACASPTPPSQLHQPDDAFAALLASSTDLGPADPARQVQVVLTLQDPAAGARAARLKATYTPGSPDFGQPMTPAEYDRTFGPDRAQVDTLSAELRNHNLSSDWGPGDTFLAVSGAVALIDQLFATAVHDYRAKSGRRFYASASDPRIPASLQPQVTGAAHLTDYGLPATRNVPPGGLKPADLAVAYDYKPLRDQGLDGSGEQVVFMEIDGFDQADLDTFNAQLNLPKTTPTIQRGPSNLPPQGETIMDLEVVHAIAPGAGLTLYSTKPTSGGTWLNFESQMVDSNPGAVISISLGGCEPAYGRSFASAEKAIFDKAAQLGESVFVATGDSGGYTCLTSDFGALPGDKYVGASAPAVYPGVTAVGGTRLSLRADNTYLAEQVWEEPAVTAGGGGAVSVYFPRPDWQAGPGVDNQYNPQQRRSIPDVAADADPASGVAIFGGGAWGQGGGTSQAAPLWAAMAVLVNQYLKKQGQKPIGFANPALYALAAGKPPFPPYHDVVTGTNLVFPATPGYDLASGLGTPDAYNLARDLEAYQKNGGRV